MSSGIVRKMLSGLNERSGHYGNKSIVKQNQTIKVNRDTAESIGGKGRQAERLYQSEMKLVKIAEKLNVPARTVRHWKSTQKRESGKNKRSPAFVLPVEINIITCALFICPANLLIAFTGTVFLLSPKNFAPTF